VFADVNRFLRRLEHDLIRFAGAGNRPAGRLIQFGCGIGGFPLGFLSSQIARFAQVFFRGPYASIIRYPLLPSRNPKNSPKPFRHRGDISM
jgi:hypothetical protein